MQRTMSRGRLLGLLAAMVGVNNPIAKAVNEVAVAQEAQRGIQYGGVKEFAAYHERHQPSYYTWKRKRRSGR